MSRPLRVAIINPSFSAGAFTHQMANALVDQGALVDVWTSPHFHRISGSWSRPRYHLLIRFYRWTQARSWNHGPARWLWRLARFLGHLASVARLLLAAGRYDVVHIYFLPVPALDALWFPLLRRRTRVAYHVHNLYPHDTPRTDRLKRQLARIYHAADVLLAHTGDTVRGLRQDFRISEQRILQIPLGEVANLIRPEAVPDRAALGIAESRGPLILMLGDARHNKGIDVLLEAGAMLAGRGVPFQIIVAGRHPAGHPDELANQARRLGLEGRVEFRSTFIPEEAMPAYLRAAAVVAFPYREIDQSAGAVWALSEGRPIIASRVGGLVDLVEEGDAGLLVPREDAAALADGLAALLADRERAERYGASGRRYAITSLAWPPVAARLLAAYRSLATPA